MYVRVQSSSRWTCVSELGERSSRTFTMKEKADVFASKQARKTGVAWFSRNTMEIGENGQNAKTT
jgi:hypothetical protein